MKQQRGLLVVLSGPSGVGKGTVCRNLLKHSPNMTLSVSATTRARREHEREGREYFFKSQEEFNEMVKNDHFLEYIHSFDKHSYGTPRKYVEEQLEKGRDVILEIEVQGGLNVKRVFPDAVMIFLAPPNMEELKKRLLKRGTQSAQSIENRTEIAYGEMQSIERYEYVVINDTVENAEQGILAILKAEKSRIARCENLINLLLERRDTI